VIGLILEGNLVWFNAIIIVVEFYYAQPTLYEHLKCVNYYEAMYLNNSQYSIVSVTVLVTSSY